MTIIEKIKAEIERQQKENVNYDENGGFASYCDLSAWSALDSMLTFVSGLEKLEKPINQEGLENEAVSYCFDNGLNLSPRVATDFARHFAKWGAKHAKKDDTPVPNDLEEAVKKCVTSIICEHGLYDGDFIIPVCEDFFKAGAEWNKEQMIKKHIPKEHSELTELEYAFYDLLASNNITNHSDEEVVKTAKVTATDLMDIAKAEMMKEAVECELVCIKDHLAAILPMKEFQWTVGDKVSIIIVKKDISHNDC